MVDAMTTAQARLLTAIKAAGQYAEYWPVVNDWVRDRGPSKSLALRNIQRTVDALVAQGYIRLDDDGLFQVLPAGDAIRIGTWLDRDTGDTYRAADIGDSVLTAPKHAGLSDAELMAEAQAEVTRGAR